MLSKQVPPTLLLGMAFSLVGLLMSCGPVIEETPERAPTLPAVAPAAQAAEPVAQESDSKPTATVNGPLAGTHWRLVEFQSMDDAIGAARPDDPSLYTLSFAADDRLSMQLNCNRATGSWSAEPSDDGDSGSLAIGPLAVTRALCPPPSIDEKIAADMDYVRSFLLRDGQLTMSLMADGGTYLWEPFDLAENETSTPGED